jgi:hypothetical protein
LQEGVCMETRILDRETILPPQPSRSRAIHALVSALWFSLVGALHRSVDGLVRLARRARERLDPRPAPDLMAETDSGPRTCVLRAYSGTQRVPEASERRTRRSRGYATSDERTRA